MPHFIPLLQGRAFGPEDIKVMSTAFDGALNALGLMDRADPLNELVAKKVIEIAKTGERNPSRLRDRALKSLQSSEPVRRHRGRAFKIAGTNRGVPA